MKSLQVREVPDHLYQKLLMESKKSHRSLSQQTIVTLSLGLKTSLSPKANRTKLLLKIKERSSEIGIQKLKNPVDLVREDRDR